MRYQAIAAASALLLGGCAHHDVLVFGTDTALAIDVQSSASQGGSPSVTIGYKRKEAVWLPLIVNGADSRALGCAPGAGAAGTPPPTCPPGNAPLDDPKYRATTITEGSGGEKVTHANAYSVVASFGAQFSGSTQNGANANGGLAQFFATGIAADNLTSNDALVTALKVDPTKEGAQAQSEAVQAVAANKSSDSITKGISDADQKTVSDQAAKDLAKYHKTANLVLICATAQDGTDRWNDLVGATTTLSDADKATYKQLTTDASRRKELYRNPALTGLLAAAGKAAPFNCSGV